MISKVFRFVYVSGSTVNKCIPVMATDGEVVVEESGLEESVREGTVVGAWVDETAAAVLTVVFTLLELALVPVFVPAPPGPAPPTRRGLSSDC